jgi:transposase InsO family protein
VVAQLEEEQYAVSRLCTVLGVCRSAYYAWRKNPCGPRRHEDLELKPMIREIFWEHKRRYGARRIAEELAACGISCGRRRVGRLMKELDLLAIQPRSFKPRTTNSRHTLGYSPNLLVDMPIPKEVNRVWVGDITYIPLLASDFLYLGLLMDLYSRRIVGWDLQDHMQESLVLQALRSSIGNRQPGPGLIHHTDRGGQYAGSEYRQVLGRAAMQQSMSRADDCYDNAVMESCFGTIKTELEMEPYPNRLIAHKEISRYIRYYNTRRRHSALDYLSPEVFEGRRRCTMADQNHGGDCRQIVTHRFHPGQSTGASSLLGCREERRVERW